MTVCQAADGTARCDRAVELTRAQRSRHVAVHMVALGPNCLLKPRSVP
jgi:hypothetical protein